MKATGDDGFEGLVRDCLEETLKQRFRLNKSGPQGGSDLRSDLPANGLQVAVEGKRYGSATKLPVEQLKLKIVAAAESQPGLDLWVLATTRRISATDVAAMTATGDAQGIAIAIVDATDGAGMPSALDLLIAASPRAAARHLAPRDALDAHLEAIRSNASFRERLELVLEPFRRQDVGYAAARLATVKWLTEALEDEATARARLHSFAGLGAADAALVRRPAVEGQFDAWLALDQPPPFAVLGDEGVGKTWSVLGWWRAVTATMPERLPLMLVVSASTIAGVGNVSGPDLVARLLADRMPIRNGAFWRRRLDLWAAAGDARPRIILAIDGLNQRTEFLRWEQIVQPLFDKRWNGMFAMLATCRTGWWNGELKGLPTVLPAIRTATVPVFSETELDEVLAMHGLRRTDFEPAMLRLLEVPRYCQLAIARRRELAETGDITIERLIYEDWRQRVRRLGSALTPTEEEFREFIAEQGRRLMAVVDDSAPSLSRRELVETLDRDAGRGEPALRTAISEIVDGGWMEPVDGRPGRWRLKAAQVPFALGLALVSELRAAGAGAAERLATFIEPLRGTDRGVAILRNATTAALLDPSVNDDVFDVLIAEWFGQQNFAKADVDRMASLAPVAPARFLSFAERLWGGARAGVRDDGLLVDGVARASGSPAFRVELHARLREWLGRYRIDAACLPFRQRDDPDALDAFVVECRARADELEAGLRTTEPSIRIMEAPDGAMDQRRLSAFAAGVLSFLPRAEFIDCLVAWACARAVDLDGGGDGVAWTLRLNEIDGAAAAAAILDSAGRLLAMKRPTATEAARRLLDAAATPDAARVSADIPRPAGTRLALRRQPAISDGIATLPRMDDNPDLGVFSGLADAATRADVVLAEAEVAALRAASADFDASKLLAVGRQRDGADLDFEGAEPALARWAPGALGELVRRTYADAANRLRLEAPNDPAEALEGLVREIPRYRPVLGREEMAAMLGAIELSLPSALAPDGNVDPWLHLQVPRLAGKTANDQIASLAGDPAGPNFFVDDKDVFEAPRSADYDFLAPLLTGPARTHWLGYLLSVGRKEMPSGYAPLLDGFEASDATARCRALRAIRFSDDADLLRQFVQSGWSWTPATAAGEAAEGSLALVAASRIAPVADLWNRIDPPALGAILEDCPTDDEALDRFADWIVGRIDALSFPEHAFEQHSWLQLDNALEVLAASRRAPDLVSALDRLIERGEEHAFGFDSFPVIDALAALCRHRPTDGARIWWGLWPAYLESSWTLGSFESVPFAGDDPALSELRDAVLWAARTDADLALVATAAQDGGHFDWLASRIDTLLADPTAGGVARGLTLARFLDPSLDGDEIWRRIQAMRLDGWLGGLAEPCHREYARGRDAATWSTDFVTATTADAALAALTLAEHSIDQRSLELAKREIDPRFDALLPAARALWNGRREKLKAKAKKAAEGRDKVLFREQPPVGTHKPWR